MTAGAERPWELGSDFDWRSAEDALANETQPLPWCRPEELITYVESGRQALGLLSQHLRAKGYWHLVMPTHFCESMIEPFLADGWEVTFVKVDDEWRCVPPERSLRAPDTSLIFSISYFGVGESPEWLDFLESEADRGALVLSDETHRVLSSGLASAHYRVGSLRKMLPVPDGAFLAGLGLDGLAAGRQGERRGVAMREKTKYLAGEAGGGHLELFRAAEDLTEGFLSPHAMSEESRRLLDAIDYSRLRDVRVANGAALREGLRGLPFRIGTAGTLIPSHAVIEGERIPELRRYLISQRIFCPIHWPLPTHLPLRLATVWRSDILSIPVDHRYTASDMRVVSRAIEEFSSENLEYR